MAEKSKRSEEPKKSETAAPNPDSKSSTPCLEDRHGQDWGYDLYPERKRPRPYNITNFFFNYQSRENVELYKIEKKLVKIIKNSPIVRIMVSALEKAGCPFNYRRHIQVEYCEPLVTGGYDPIQNQIVICYNSSRSEGAIHSVLIHELVHMFDYCTREMDYKNIDHLACSEIRAANLTYCSYLSAFFGKHIDRSKIKLQHPECIKRRASDSVYAVRPVTREEADAAVERVFDKCYNDLEPIGRRIKRSNKSHDLAYSEAFLLGYD